MIITDEMIDGAVTVFSSNYASRTDRHFAALGSKLTQNHKKDPASRLGLTG